MWVKMGSRLLNLDRFTEIRKVKTDAGWFVWLDLMKLPMDNESDADHFINDIAEGLHGHANIIYLFPGERY